MQKLVFDLERVNKHYDNLLKEIIRVAASCKTQSEETLKVRTMLEFEKFFENFEISLNDSCKYEQSMIGPIKLKGRSDVLTGSLIIEFKKSYYLSNKTNEQKAIGQVLDNYLKPLNADSPKYQAIVFDGKSIIFFHYNPKKSKWDHDKKPLNKYTLYDWILLILGRIKIPISSNNLITSFSIHSDLAIETIELFYNKLNKNINNNPRVKMLYEEWKKSFSYIYGGILNENKIKKDFSELAVRIIANSTNIHTSKFLFCFYTYYALIVKLYASEISSIHLNIAPESPINTLANSSDLKNSLSDIENGEFFKRYARIENYIEGGFFSWYLDAWDDDMQNKMQSIMNELNKFDFGITGHIRSKDILKNLYQEIIPQKIRHDLGEYYTPDWLIQSVLDDVGYVGKIDKKILDAGCGSGGFLVEVINRIKKKNNANPEKLISMLTTNVVGFDVNPVAVLTARTNYLLAIAPLLSSIRTSFLITIPIYLADSIITPTTEGKGEISDNSYKISTVEGMFVLPKDFVDFGYLNEGMQIIDQCLQSNYPTRDFIKTFKKNIALKDPEFKQIEIFYEKIVELHSKDKNRIWLKLIQNSFAPLLHTEFDYVVGNPPWIKWDFLSKDYKDRLGHLYLDIYKLFSHTGMNARLGFSHDDISVVFLYVAADKYLKNRGKLGFVMKQTLYKSIAGKEFRKFKIEKNNELCNLKVVKVNDMLDLKPFRSSANAETSTLILEKNSKTTYPISYNIWKLKNTQINENNTLEEIKDNITIECKDASPNNPDDLKDTWIISDQGNIHTYNKIKNHYKPRHGIVNDLNAVFFINILEKDNSFVRIENNVISRAKKKVKNITVWIENDCVYPMLKPKNIKKWKIDGYEYVILPQKHSGEKNESIIRTKYPKTYHYLHRFKEELNDRSSDWFKMPNIPFYSIFGIGPYSFGAYKIVWSCMGYSPKFVVVSNVKNKFIGTKKIMPDNTIGSISVNTSVEAHYVCSILNSKIVTTMFDNRSSKSKWGISITMVADIPIPAFDKHNLDHLKLSTLSKDAHSSNCTSLSIIEKKIDDLCNKVIHM